MVSKPSGRMRRTSDSYKFRQASKEEAVDQTEIKWIEAAEDTSDPKNCHDFTIIKTLSECGNNKILLGRDVRSKERFVLKAIKKLESGAADCFYQQMRYNYFLSPHPNIVTSFNISYSWSQHFVYVQEYAPYGSLSRYLKKEKTLTETQAKYVAQQVGSALDFIHGCKLVHLGIVPSNILIFQRDLSVIKLCDFQHVRPLNSLAAKTNDIDLNYKAPELSARLLNEKYYCHSSIDVWQLGILILVCLTGSVPWRVSDPLKDGNFQKYTEWLKRKSIRMPEVFENFTPRLLRLLKRLLDPKPSKRCAALEVSKYMKDTWIKNGQARIEVKNLERSASCGNDLYASSSAGGMATLRCETMRRCPTVSPKRKVERSKPDRSPCASNFPRKEIVNAKESSENAQGIITLNIVTFKGAQQQGRKFSTFT